MLQAQNRMKLYEEVLDKVVLATVIATLVRYFGNALIDVVAYIAAHMIPHIGF